MDNKNNEKKKDNLDPIQEEQLIKEVLQQLEKIRKKIIIKTCILITIITISMGMLLYTLGYTQNILIIAIGCTLVQAIPEVGKSWVASHFMNIKVNTTKIIKNSIIFSGAMIDRKSVV